MKDLSELAIYWGMAAFLFACAIAMVTAAVCFWRGK
jgi:hypothetical protein